MRPPPSPNTPTFITTLELFICSLLETSERFQASLPNKWEPRAMRFLCSPSITETAKLHYNFQCRQQEKEWKYFLIQFMDVGALLEFKHLLAHIGKDRVALAALQWLLHPPNQPKSHGTESNTLLIIPVVAAYSKRITADITWSKYLISILAKHAVLLTQTRVNSTLGGAYASLQRTERAAWWAKFQLYTAFQLGDSILQTKALLHLAFYCIRIHKFSMARRLISAQRKKAIVMENETLQVIADAADLALSKEISLGKPCNDSSLRVHTPQD